MPRRNFEFKDEPVHLTALVEYFMSNSIDVPKYGDGVQINLDRKKSNPIKRPIG